MKTFIISLSINLLVAQTAFATNDDKKSRKKDLSEIETIDKKKQINTKEANGENNLTEDSTLILSKQSPLDCLKNETDNIIKRVKNNFKSQPIASSHINAYINHLLSDTLPNHESRVLELSEQLMYKLQSLNLADKTAQQKMVFFVSSARAMKDARQVLNLPYNAAKIKQVESVLKKVKENELFPSHMIHEAEQVLKGLDYYERKVVLRRVNDLADDLLVLHQESSTDTLPVIEIEGLVDNTIDSIGTTTSWSAREDSLFHSAVEHEGRNRLIAYVPYANELRKRMVDAFPLDEKGHILTNHIRWEDIENIKKEVEAVLKQ